MSSGNEAFAEAWARAAKPGSQHEALAGSVGSWSVTVKMWMDPSQPPEVSEGSAERTLILGGRVVEERFTGAGMGGGPYEGLGHYGYDNVLQRHWSTWTDNMATGVGVFYGNEAAGDGPCVMEGEMPDPMSGGSVSMRIEIRMDGADREINEFFRPGPDGQMYKNMELIYQRR